MQAETDAKCKEKNKLTKQSEAATKKLRELEREQATVTEKDKHLKVRCCLPLLHTFSVAQSLVDPA